MAEVKLGDIKYGREIGLKTKQAYKRVACIDCGREGWVRQLWGEPRSERCHSCAAKLAQSERIVAWPREIPTAPPEVGEIRQARDIGKNNVSNFYQKYVWQLCDGCGKARWVLIRKGKPLSFRCYSCSVNLRRGELNNGWKGGRKTTRDNYIKVHLKKDDFFYPMADKNGYVMEHRLIMAKHVGRCLYRWEVVHHRGTKYPLRSRENKRDNRIENLQLFTGKRHGQITLLENRIAYLEKRITLLEAESVLARTSEVIK